MEHPRSFAPRTRVAATVVALALPVLAACGVEKTGGTYQSASGNGVETSAPGVEVDGATLVAGTEGSGRAAFLGTVFNVTGGEDELIAIVAGGTEATLQPDPVPLPAGRGVPIQTGQQVQAEFPRLDAEPGTYVPVRMIFRNAGALEFSAMLVPPYGFYADAAPADSRRLPDEQLPEQALPNGEPSPRATPEPGTEEETAATASPSPSS